ncbi:MAG: DUF1343 domain-containing protein [Armatimonadetes bacterium]|nr:DUF1343 domain-containing protein [Armatimonadota bacterium]MBX3108036.1 DUF1343 domain-containing protein [Fimbriimonadaceae bacterium]
MSGVATGLDLCIYDGFSRFHGKSIGVVCHQASIAGDLRHLLDHLVPQHQAGKLKIAACFGPQHGIWGHTQDNMVEWEGYTDPRTGLPFFSLYGEHRKPTAAMLEGVEELVFDVQDVGSRYYTFIWTLAHCMEACAALGIPVTVLDRPNPIGGTLREGPGFDPEYKSFVGLYPLPVRHGMTVGEVALSLRDRFIPDCQISVVAMQGWEREMAFGDTGLAWGMPSPNMPSQETALVYPGQCLVEGTKLSEGRGTTRPFEYFGAPFIDAWEYCEAVNRLGLPGVVFRPVHFQPTFQKFQGQICGGAFIHVTDKGSFRPVLTTMAALGEIRRLYGDQFEWLEPPYEYEPVKLPIDILAGGPDFREMVDRGEPVPAMREWIDSSSRDLCAKTASPRLY